MNLFESIITSISYIKNPIKRKWLRFDFLFKNKKGLEIGGPSAFFQLKSPLPIYAWAKRIDGVNFSNNTLWEGALQEGELYQYSKNKKGFQFIHEATSLTGIPNSTYDFIISCHSLEHTANPIKALMEWKRVLGDKGSLALILPDKNYTFDFLRPITTIEHLIEDYKNHTSEMDETHFEEVITLSDLTIGNSSITNEEFIQRTYRNYENRAVHHHVFDLNLVKAMLEYVGFKLLYQEAYSNLHLVAVAQKI
jgi:SAM-dependent methyltransferase